MGANGMILGRNVANYPKIIFLIHMNKRQNKQSTRITLFDRYLSYFVTIADFSLFRLPEPLSSLVSELTVQAFSVWKCIEVYGNINPGLCVKKAL